MSTDKPDVVSDPAAPENSIDEQLHQRFAEEIEQQKSGGVVNVVDGQPVINVQTEVTQLSGGSADVTTQETSPSNEDANAVALKLIEVSTGRKFDKLEDAHKFLTNLNSLVGDQNIARARESEKVLTNLSKKFGKDDIKELESYLMGIIVEQVQPKEVKPKEEPVSMKPEAGDSEVAKRLERLEHENQLLALEKKYPKAAEVAEEVALIAKFKGISYVEAFEKSPLKNLIDLKEKEEVTKNPIVTPSNKINIDTKKVEELGKRVMSGKSSSEERTKLVSEVLGL